MQNVAIFDRHPVFILGLTDILTAAGFHVIESDTMIRWPCSLHANVFLIDIDTIESADEILPELAKIAPVLLVVADAAQELGGYLTMGATGIVDRRSSAEELLSTVVTALDSGETEIPAQASTRQRLGADQLSPREQQVIRHIAGGLTHGQVARLLGISPHTVDTYVKRIRSKLDLGNKAELTRAAIDVGFVQH